MSSQWEIVGKNKRSNTAEKKNTLVQKNSVAEKRLKLEDLFASQNIKAVLSNKDGKKKENKQINNKSAIQKKVKQQEPQKKLIVNQQKPKNLETALSTLSAKELIDLIENIKRSFPESQLLWLKAVASHLNGNLHVEDDVCFNTKPFQYPSNILPKHIKSVIVALLKDVDEVSLFYSYDQLLTALAVDMSKNQPSLGYKIMLQIIGQLWPKVCLNSLAKNAILRNSYQNRSIIGLSILWSLGQGGYYDISVGLKVWLNIMLPIIDLKSYTRFICDYILQILQLNNNASINLSQDEFIAAYTALKETSGLAQDCQAILNQCRMLFVERYIQSSNKVFNVFQILFRNIVSKSQSKAEISGCFECLVKNEECFKIWKMNYKKNILSSSLLFDYMNEKWNTFPRTQMFRDFLYSAKKLNIELSNSKKMFPNLDEAIYNLSVLLDKSTQKKKLNMKKKSICPWIFGIIGLITGIGVVITYDYNVNLGVFEKSTTGKFLKDYGALPYVEYAWYKTMSTGARCFKWTEENAPIFYEKTRPFIKLGQDLSKMLLNAACNIYKTFKNLIVEKSPTVVSFIESYIPGFTEKVSEISLTVWEYSVEACNNGYNFFKTNVFVGSLSPENLGKALNQTQKTAAQYYSWFHEKIEIYAKIK